MKFIGYDSSLGINIGNISVVAHYRYPYSGESYIQRVGRAGRSKEVFNKIEEILKDGISLRPDRKRLLQLYLERLHHRKDLIEFLRT